MRLIESGEAKISNVQKKDNYQAHTFAKEVHFTVSIEKEKKDKCD